MPKPITIYMHKPGPNPWKVVIILEELGLEYKEEYPADVKSAEFTKINPNGRVPAIGMCSMHLL